MNQNAAQAAAPKEWKRIVMRVVYRDRRVAAGEKTTRSTRTTDRLAGDGRQWANGASRTTIGAYNTIPSGQPLQLQ
ncbi:MAG TPA: hypothetical protein PLS67_09510 [Accumulibacter sp.]|jgi:hypothetical protein|nr:hypothetical protein [Accumulibacter sp.]